ncbi:MAG: 50S ribosomal protein L18 [Endomicrobium sp.]|jgi:large subunit ribosomal protein L18|nr:50S ribosomal protein L18 [Endomicrobium sp.]
MRNSVEKFRYRINRVRGKIKGTKDRPRLSVYRGNRHVYAQIIDDVDGITLVSSSTLSSVDLDDRTLNNKNNILAAKLVGSLIAKKAIDKGLKRVVFDRRGYKYTGKIKALADAARNNGLEF